MSVQFDFKQFFTMIATNGNNDVVTNETVPSLFLMKAEVN